MSNPIKWMIVDGKKVYAISSEDAVFTEDGNPIKDKLTKANPELSGSEESLTSIQIGNVKYKLSSLKAGTGISIADDGTISVTFENGDDLSYGTSADN